MKGWSAVLIGVASLGCAAATANARDDLQPNGVTPEPLHVSGSVAFGEYEGFAWLPPVHCDDGGRLFMLIVLPGHPSPDQPQPPPGPIPTDILRISADGKETTFLTPAAAPALADADRLRTLATAVDSGGSLFALVAAYRGENTSQYLVAFNKEGRYDSTVEVDQEEIFAVGFEVFDTGDYLLQGFRKDGEPRITVMSPGGSSFSDVFALSGFALDGREPVKSGTHLVRGGNDRVYFLPGGEDSVYAIDPSGNSREVLKLDGMQAGFRVVGLKAAEDRLAVTYYQPPPQEDTSGRFWIAIYNAPLSELEGTYGPVSNPPLCYQYDGRHEFTALKDSKHLVTLTP